MSKLPVMLGLLYVGTVICTAPSWAEPVTVNSDTFGVRSNTGPNSPLANFRDFSGALVGDKTLTELSGDTDSSDNQITFSLFSSPFFFEPGNLLPTPCPDTQACLGGGARVNLGVTGYAFLREPGTFEISDQVSVVFQSTGVAGSNLVDVTITLNSDPFSGGVPAPAGTVINENGLFQDLSSRIFNIASDPTHFGETVVASDSTGFPFHVLVASDVPEPSRYILLMAGFGVLLYALRTRSHWR
jgi:hypothetical protein